MFSRLIEPLGSSHQYCRNPLITGSAALKSMPNKSIQSRHAWESHLKNAKWVLYGRVNRVSWNKYTSTSRLTLMHNKRPAPLAPSSLLVSAAKRARTRISDGASSKAAALDAFPTIEEIVHHIFSYLDAENLCTIQRKSHLSTIDAILRGLQYTDTLPSSGYDPACLIAASCQQILESSCF